MLGERADRIEPSPSWATLHESRPLNAIDIDRPDVTQPKCCEML